MRDLHARMLAALLGGEGLCGIAPADTGFIALPLQPAQLVKTCARGRKLMETVGSYLTERFGVGCMSTTCGIIRIG